MAIVIQHESGEVTINGQGGKNHIVVRPGEGEFVSRTECTTSYPPDLIEAVLSVKGVAYLCDELLREEDPGYVEECFQWDILCYFDESDFAGKRILDFGSGAGSSGLTLARMLPDSEIVGIEVRSDLVELARKRTVFRSLQDRLRFVVSPDSKSIPPDLGEFDFALLSAVYEHLLPAERARLPGLLWKVIKPGGVLFIGQTPHRWFPIESHTTGFPLINFLPDRAVLYAVRLFSNRFGPDATWEEMLKAGIRGATLREIKKNLVSVGAEIEVLRPDKKGVKDHIDLWYRYSFSRNPTLGKKLLRIVLKLIYYSFNILLVPNLSLALRKSK